MAIPLSGGVTLPDAVEQIVQIGVLCNEYIAEYIVSCVLKSCVAVVGKAVQAAMVQMDSKHLPLDAQHNAAEVIGRARQLFVDAIQKQLEETGTNEFETEHVTCVLEELGPQLLQFRQELLVSS